MKIKLVNICKAQRKHNKYYISVTITIGYKIYFKSGFLSTILYKIINPSVICSLFFHLPISFHLLILRQSSNWLKKIGTFRPSG